MTFKTHTLWEILISTFGVEVWRLLIPALKSTLIMVSISTLITLIAGVFVGMLLFMTDKDSLYPKAIFNKILSSMINVLRSLPSMIMIIITLPMARALTGKGYGMPACIIALSMSCIPMYARLVENCLFDVGKGKIEAAKSMGINHLTILFTVILPEALPAVIRSFTVAVIAIISMTALAGCFGAGGIGNVAVQYGFNRFRYDILIATVVLLIVLAELVQLSGNFLAKRVLKKRHLL